MAAITTAEIDVYLRVYVDCEGDLKKTRQTLRDKNWDQDLIKRVEGTPEVVRAQRNAERDLEKMYSARLQSMQLEALNRLVELIRQNKNQDVARKAADSLLDRLKGRPSQAFKGELSLEKKLAEIFASEDGDSE